MEQRTDLATGLCYHMTQQEIRRRHALVREFMREKEIGALLILVPYQEGYRWWISGTEGTERRTESCFVIFSSGEILHVVGNRLAKREEEARQPVGAQPDPPEAFAGVRTVYQLSAFEIGRELQEGSAKRLGFVHGEEIRVDLYRYLREHLPGIEMVDVTRELMEKKAVKSPEEQELAGRAASLQERVLEGLFGYLRPGITEADAVRHARFLANRLGSGGIDAMESAKVELISWPDSGEENPSCVLGNHPKREPLYYPGRYLKQGDLIQIGLTIRGDSGFYGFLSRLLSLGEPSKEARESWRKAVRLQELIAEKLMPAKRAEQVQQEVRAAAREQGIYLETADFLRGIGYCVSEAPDGLHHSMDLTLQEGMILAADPKVRDEKGNLYCCGDVYRITKTGAVCMTNMPWEIKVL